MEKKFGVLILIGIFATIFYFAGIKIKYYFVCDFSMEGGAPGGSKPAYCSAEERKIKQQQDKKMLEQFQKDITFECKIQNKPELSPETQQLYNYAYYHDLHNLWNPQEAVWDKLVHYYRIAAANGDYKANVRLQYLLESGRIDSQNAILEAMNLNKELEKQLPATAYYKNYTAINDGHITTEEDGQFAFLRKAAELGSAEAQFELSNVIMEINDEITHSSRVAFSNELEKCASNNGFGKASQYYAIGLQRGKNYNEALKAYNNGVRQGYSTAALSLADAFEFKSKKFEPGDTGINDDLGLDLDLERAKRYAIIQNYLSTNDYLNPKVPDLDQIVPLPPAKLPAWDGKIAFQHWYEGPSPEKPSEELVEKLAKAKGLDPKIGLPIKR